MSWAGSHMEAFIAALEGASSMPHAVGSEADAAAAEPTRTVWVPKESVGEPPRVQAKGARACAQRRVKFDVYLRASSFAELEQVEDALIVGLDTILPGPGAVRWGNPGQYSTTEGSFTLRREVELCFAVHSETHITGRPLTARTSTTITDPLGENPETAEAGAPP